jgi:putative ABC transport system permease protein
MPSINAKLAIRQLQKNRVFTTLNIFGLTLGLTTFLLIVLYINDELSFDRCNVRADRIVRINTDIFSDGNLDARAGGSPAVAPTLISHYPEVETAVRMLPEGGVRFRMGTEDRTEQRVATVDPDLFRVFTLPAIDGDPVKGMQQPGTLVLTATTAMRYFNTVHAAGRTLVRLDDSSRLYTVAAVVEDVPAQSHFQFDIFLTTRGNELEQNHAYNAILPMPTYVLLKPGTDRVAFDRKLTGFMRESDKKYAEMEDDNKGKFYIRLSEIPLLAIHLHSHRVDEIGKNSDIQYVYIFSAIAVFVLLIAGINFMNLSTARSFSRAREVGVRKVLGSRRMQLMFQFLTESLLVTAGATLLAFLLTWLALPAFNRLTGKAIVLSGPILGWLLPALLGIVAVVGLFSGAWPAFFLSAFRPVQVLKSRLAMGGKGSGFRSVLVVLQFSITMLLMIGALVVFRQLNYIQHRDPGYDRSQVLVIKDLDGVPDPVELKKEILRIPGVTAATLTDFLPTGGNRWHNWAQAGDSGYYKQTDCFVVDEDYVPTLAMHLVRGRNFSHDMPTDSEAVVINESAARVFGIEKDPLGKHFKFAGHWQGDGEFTIIGVVKDFNFASVRSAITPVGLVMATGHNLSGLNIRIAGGHTPGGGSGIPGGRTSGGGARIPDVLARIKSAWAAYAPNKPFDYSFMDDDFDAVYRAEQRIGGVVILLTGLAILIACLGLFGLAAYAAEQRARELGIRKVLGASVRSILILLSRDFARLIVIAVCIASPLAWWVMQGWLQNFAYRTTMPLWIFAAAAALVFCVALLTTLAQSRKAAVTNPVEVLRGE